MIPGVSRSGATILGAMSFGVDRKTAAEFSFFLALPTLTGATMLQLFKHRDAITTNDLGLIAVGAFVRSEEQTSELQSLMRISYAVFCLKKKKETERQYPISRDTTFTC